MIRRIQLIILSFALYIPFILPANAVIILAESLYNIDGVVFDSSNPSPMTGALDSNGLGSLSYNFTTAGTHSITAFFDYEIDQSTNIFFNEYGATTGTAAAGQSWEIDEPGFVFGDIYDNVLAGSLDNSNQVTINSVEDTSFALGWDFTLADGETGLVSFNLVDILPSVLPDFYLTHADEESPDTIFAWSTLDITSDSINVPEPGTLFLMGFGLVCVGLFRKKHNNILVRS